MLVHNAAQAQQALGGAAPNAVVADRQPSPITVASMDPATSAIAGKAADTPQVGTSVARASVGGGSEPPSAGRGGSAVPTCTDAASPGATKASTETGLAGRTRCRSAPGESGGGGGGSGAATAPPTLEQVSYEQAVLASDDPLTQAQRGLGKVDGGMDELDQTLGQPQIFSDIRTLQDQILTGGRPLANAVGRFSSQSDHLDISQEEASLDIFFSEGRSQLRLGVQALRYTPDRGYGIKQRATGFTGSYRISEAAAVSGEFWFNWFTADQNKHSTTATYDVFVTLWPSDYVRIDVDTNGRTFDNVRSLQLGIVARSVGGSVDYMPTDRLRLTVRGRGGFYSDGNSRQSGEAEVVWRALSRPRIDVGVLGTAFHYDKLFDNGYFNPRNYRSGEAMTRLQTDFGKKLTAELAGSAGVETSDPGGAKPLVKASLRAWYKLPKNWSLDGAVSHFSSRTSTSSGFSRTSFTAGLHLRF